MMNLRLAIATILMLQLIAVLQSGTAHKLVITNLLDSGRFHVTCHDDDDDTNSNPVNKTEAPLQNVTIGIVQNPSWTCWGNTDTIHMRHKIYDQMIVYGRCKENCLLKIDPMGYFIQNEETRRWNIIWPKYIL